MSVSTLYRDLVEAGETEFDDAQAAAAERLSDLADRISGWRRGPSSRVRGKDGPGETGVWLHGAVGTGKSMLMDLFFEAVRVKRKRRAHLHAFKLEVHALKAEALKAQEKDLMAAVAKTIAAECSLLCLDEFEVANIADGSILGRLFEKLFGRGVVLVTTSNVHPDDLYKDGVNRDQFLPVIALLKEHTEIVELDAKQDYRLVGAEAERIWFDPFGPEADAGLDALWEKLRDGAVERGEEIALKGRTLRAPRAAGDAARFSFEELCARPLSAEDYLALARRFATVAVDRIPKLGPEKRDEAHRLTNLIDALYEGGARLVASADGEPADIYTEGDGVLRYARALSRLMEMRRRKYLTKREVF